MSTENRRVATYLPKELDDRLKDFIAQRSLKGDSPALIAILSEFFGVSQEVAHPSSSELQILVQRIESLESTVNKPDDISSSLEKINELLSSLLVRVSKLELDSVPMPQAPQSISNSVPGQMDLLPLIEQMGSDGALTVSELKSELKSELLELLPNGLGQNEFARRLGVGKSTVAGWKDKGEEALGEHTAKLAPYYIPWRYDKSKKRYFPVILEKASQ